MHGSSVSGFFSPCRCWEQSFPLESFPKLSIKAGTFVSMSPSEVIRSSFLFQLKVPHSPFTSFAGKSLEKKINHKPLKVTPETVTPLKVTPLNVKPLNITPLNVTSLNTTPLKVEPSNVTS